MLNHHPLILKFERRFELTDKELKAVGALEILARSINANQDIVSEGDRASRCVIILAGLAGTSKTDKNGKRQTVGFHFPGDMPDLSTLHLDVLDSDIRTVGRCTIAFIDHSDIRALCDQHPRLASALWRETLVDASIFREWVVNVGSRRALNRMAHLLCEVMLRMEAIGSVVDLTCEFRVTQTDLGEATGLSLVHVNRMLQDLRDMELASFANGVLKILDWSKLSRMSDFRPQYLHLN